MCRLTVIQLQRGSEAGEIRADRHFAWQQSLGPNVRFGQKRTLKRLHPMSALPPKADIETQPRNVRFVPKADIGVHSISSSASAISLSGIVRPSALAVLRLMISSNFVGACTGRSAGFSPLRM